MQIQERKQLQDVEKQNDLYITHQQVQYTGHVLIIWQKM
jgi:hypothetical protein